MAMEKNKVKFGLNKVHYAKILSFDDEGVPTFAEPVRIPGAVSQMTACIMSSTITLVTPAILKSHWFRLSLRQTFSERNWMKRAFSRKPILQKYPSLHCCLNSAAIRIKFGTVCSAVPPLVRQQNPAPLRTKRKLKRKRCL